MRQFAKWTHFFVKKNQKRLLLQKNNNNMSKIFLNIALLFTIATVQSQNLGNFSFENAHANRQFMTPTAFSLPKGNGYYKNTDLLFNSVNYGVTDRFSIGASADILGLFSTNHIPFLTMLTAKYSVPVGKNVGIAGGMTLSMLSDKSTSTLGKVGLLYALVTFGNPNHHVTIGGGIPKAYQVDGPITGLFTVSGQFRLGDHFSLITENWFTQFNDVFAGIGSLGGRYMSQNFAIDGALLYGKIKSDTQFRWGKLDINGVIPIPILSLTIPFKTN
jgi:hypothetical protein